METRTCGSRLPRIHAPDNYHIHKHLSSIGFLKGRFNSTSAAMQALLLVIECQNLGTID